MALGSEAIHRESEVRMLGRSLSVIAVGLALLLRREPPLAPPFPSQDPARWVGTPVRLEELRGRVVLLDVWTFG
jgi:hypothetical protein